MVMLSEFLYQVIEVALAEDHEVIEAILPERLGELLHESEDVRRTVSGPLNSQAGIFENSVERVVHQHVGRSEISRIVPKRSPQPVNCPKRSAPVTVQAT